MRDAPRPNRFVTLVLRPKSPPLICGIALAAVLIGAEILVVLQLKRIAPENAFGAVFLFGVLVVSAGWGFTLAIATSVASTVAYAYIHVVESSESLVPAVLVFLALALLTNMLVGQSRLRAMESESLQRHTATLARRQAALRRVATLVALRGEPVDVYSAVTDELSTSLDVEHVSLVQYETDGYVVLAARDDASEDNKVTPGERFALGGNNISTRVHATNAPVTLELAVATGPVAERLRQRGLLSGFGVPIDSGVTGDVGVVWGAVIVGASSHPPDSEIHEHLQDFADLIATAVYNTDTRLQLTQSRARVVAAADQARRTIERDLHDGAQQRIVSLGMQLRAARGSAEDRAELRNELDRCIETLSQVHTDLRELSRGIHPAVLSRGGLAPALKTLARRSPVPVSLTTSIPTRLPETVEVAAYYVVAEALTNTAKYARASEVTISADVVDGLLSLTVVDDGCGGADRRAGSGLIGLHDRVAAVGGTLDIVSPVGEGTAIRVRVPGSR